MSLYDADSMQWLYSYDRLSCVLIFPLFIFAVVYLTPIFLIGWIARKVKS